MQFREVVFLLVSAAFIVIFALRAFYGKPDDAMSRSAWIGKIAVRAAAGVALAIGIYVMFDIRSLHP